MLCTEVLPWGGIKEDIGTTPKCNPNYDLDKTPKKSELCLTCDFEVAP